MEIRMQATFAFRLCLSWKGRSTNSIDYCSNIAYRKKQFDVLSIYKEAKGQRVSKQAKETRPLKMSKSWDVSSDLPGAKQTLASYLYQPCPLTTESARGRGAQPELHQVLPPPAVSAPLLSISLWHPLPFPAGTEASLGMVPSGIPPHQWGASLCSAWWKRLMITKLIIET